MAKTIRITAGTIVLEAEIDDSDTAKRVYDALPIRAPGQRWGEEIYFEIPVDVGEAPDARELMEVGELAYWPTGKAFCIFFGPTPASTDARPRAASAVNPIGKVLKGATALTTVASGTEIVLEKS